LAIPQNFPKDKVMTTSARLLDYVPPVVRLVASGYVVVVLLFRRSQRSSVTRSLVTWVVLLCISAGFEFWRDWQRRGASDLFTIGSGVYFASTILMLLLGYYVSRDGGL
jgi:hypothetical protein